MPLKSDLLAIEGLRPATKDDKFDDLPTLAKLPGFIRLGEAQEKEAGFAGFFSLSPTENLVAVTHAALDAAVKVFQGDEGKVNALVARLGAHRGVGTITPEERAALPVKDSFTSDEVKGIADRLVHSRKVAADQAAMGSE